MNAWDRLNYVALTFDKYQADVELQETNDT